MSPRPPKKAAGKKVVLQLPAVQSRVLGVNVYRGFARLCDLAEVSKADIYDQRNNPKGTQRDLSPAHARKAYEYVKMNDLGFWPEVFLCVRRKSAVKFSPLSDEWPTLGILELSVKPSNKHEIVISRVDGNHRLHYADGKEKGYTRVEKEVSFCLAYDLNREEEIQLFKDINQNQKPMSTSHLDGIEVRLTPEEELKRRRPELYIAQQLGSDSNSPLFGRVFEGGKKPVGADIPLRALKTGVEYMLTRSTQLPSLEDAEAQYRVIKNYVEAVKQWQPKAWSSPKDYILLRGAGLWAMFFIGAQVIDRALQQGSFKTTSMLEILRSGKDWDWSKAGDFKGFSGRGGALEISKKVTAKLHNENSISTKQLFDQIMASGSR
jgi:DGQHR domain-containing protein